MSQKCCTGRGLTGSTNTNSSFQRTWLFVFALSNHADAFVAVLQLAQVQNYQDAQAAHLQVSAFREMGLLQICQLMSLLLFVFVFVFGSSKQLVFGSVFCVPLLVHPFLNADLISLQFGVVILAGHNWFHLSLGLSLQTCKGARAQSTDL